MTTQKGRAGQILGAMFSGRGTSLGVRMTKQIKKVGCANFKTLVEGDKLLINDFNIIEEMSTFSRKGNSWAELKKGVMMIGDVSSHIWLVIKSILF